ncbi:hypothetical protein [Mucilaginibacter sp. KACC 22063]|uniref:hypothetical protein n=1 Tax=Mucilaginibacter sp. KACC 22063 TaxID=3025666 RepID=UPI002365EF49|nr:hypothetical protein [Mucilaginibacter sp. KACC 22063]WDF53677.1 hypothetical protein PQ461_12045 [Mucilaginibacter sp. KACC 22063]
MSNKKNISKEISDFEKISNQQNDIDQKLDELITLLAQSNLDSESIKNLQNRFNTAVQSSNIDRSKLKDFEKMDELSATASREELLDEFSILLTNHRIDSAGATNYIKKERLSSVVLILIAVLMIGLGFAMIVMPAPPYFEMFTIYYFNPNDGVTIMDVISLIIILAGVYLLIKTFYQKKTLP